MMQVEGQLAAVTTQHDKYVAETEERIEAATNTVDVFEQQKQQLLRQLDEKQRYCSVRDAMGSCDDCLEVKGGIIRTVLCCIVTVDVHSHKHT